MPDLNENQKRRLIAAFQYADDLLSQSLIAAAPVQPGLFSRCVADLTPADLRCIESNIEKIREHILRLLKRFEIPLPSPSIPSSWILKTNLTSLDLVLEELYPDRMRGYGEMDPITAGDLARMLQEVRRLLAQLFDFLGERSGSREK